MNAIEVTNLVKHYRDVKAVDDISFTIKEGTICGILGPNGSGKTTTIKCICNIIIPDQGEIKLLGKDHYQAYKYISTLFEGNRNLYWRLTPRENLRYFAGLRGLGGRKLENQIDELLERFNLQSKRNVVVNNLSRGMQQKVAIAMTLISNTDIVLLDEPTLGLDVQTTVEIKNILRSISKDMKKTVLLSSHDMHLVQDVCEEVIVINKGKVVVQDRVSNLLDMFSRMTYEIVFLEHLTEELKDELQSFNNKFYLINDSKIELDLASYDEIYSLVDYFKEKNLTIKEFKQKEINFERIYLEYTKEVN
ncbi:MAG: ABC transporter ATP-binding protein [Bacilli bacterium]|nr:ABC transporter ATP-binding protein [Bacilli bacterium]